MLPRSICLETDYEWMGFKAAFEMPVFGISCGFEEGHESDFLVKVTRLPLTKSGCLETGNYSV
jgi:hypothetical protein